MLDAGFHQAMSLQRVATQANLCVIPVVSHGEPEIDQATMWELCTALQGLGYPVAVLDGTSVETPENLGLIDLLQDAVWDNGTQSDSDAMSVIPAARGLRMLRPNDAPAPSAAAPLDALRDVFRMYRAVIVYADIATLAPLLNGSGAEPFIFLPPNKEAVVSAYNSFKHLHLQTGGLATLVTVVPDTDDIAAAQQAARVQSALCNCAQTHLGMAPRSLLVCLDKPHDMQRLALQLLENAINIGSTFSTMPLLATVVDGREVRTH